MKVTKGRLTFEKHRLSRPSVCELKEAEEWSGLEPLSKSDSAEEPIGRGLERPGVGSQAVALPRLVERTEWDLAGPRKASRPDGAQGKKRAILGSFSKMPIDREVV